MYFIVFSGARTLSITTLSIKGLFATLGINDVATTLSVTPFSIMILIIKGLSVTRSIPKLSLC
jgi:hypothetical protein